MKIIWKRGFIRLVLVGGIIWMLLILVVLLFHVWSCQSSVVFFSGTPNYLRLKGLHEIILRAFFE